MASSVVGSRGSSKALSEAKLVPKIGHGHCLVVCCPSDPLKLSESPWNHFIWEVCSANWWAELKTATTTASIDQQKGPNLLHNNDWPHIAQPELKKLNKLGYEILPHPPYSPDPLPTDCHFFKHLDNFLQKKCFHSQQEAEIFQEFVESWSMDFYSTGIN